MNNIVNDSNRIDDVLEILEHDQVIYLKNN